MRTLRGRNVKTKRNASRQTKKPNSISCRRGGRGREERGREGKGGERGREERGGGRREGEGGERGRKEREGGRREG